MMRSVLFTVAILIGAPAAAANLESGLARCAGMKSDLQRLACFDALAPKPGKAKPAESHALVDVLDKHVAESLVDPLSAIDYQVSSAFQCSLADPDLREIKCACYSVNAKNRASGYSGKQVYFVQLIVVDDFYGVIGDGVEANSSQAAAACAGAGLTDRSSAEIAKYVNR